MFITILSPSGAAPLHALVNEFVKDEVSFDYNAFSGGAEISMTELDEFDEEAVDKIKLLCHNTYYKFEELGLTIDITMEEFEEAPELSETIVLT